MIGKYAAEKFTPPVVTDVVQRPRLHASLIAGPAAPTTLVAAAAGWGKTIFAASWLSLCASDRAAVWVSLDDADDDPHAFWCAVATPLLAVCGAQAAEALQRVTAGAIETDDLPRALATALRHAPGPIALVLDNLHEIGSPQVHDGLFRLVERPPPTLSLLVTTRRDPPWPLQRLRLAGLVTDVRAPDLAFRTDEAAELFKQLKIDLTRSQLEQLVKRTEGWAAGFRLVAVHLKTVDDVDAAITAFSGDDHSVADYLMSEVLDRQPPEMVSFLETISVVDLVCAELADALSGGRDGARVLTDLAASHLFVQAVGQPGRWYRLHRLIADVLRARPAPRRRRRDLHRRAAEWFRNNGMPLEAVHSAVAGQLWPLAASLAGTHTLQLTQTGRSRTLERTLATIPSTVRGAHPELAGALALVRVAQGSDAEVAELIRLGRAAAGAVSARRTARARLLLDLSAAGLARIAGDWAAAEAALESVPDPQALASLAIAGAEIVPVIVANNLGTAALWAGRLEAAERYLTEAKDARLDGLRISQLNAAAYHSLLRCERGELEAAEAEAQSVIDTASKAGLQTAVQSAAAYLTMARVTLDRDDTDETGHWLERIADVEAQATEPHVRLAAALILATQREAAGDPKAALLGLRAHGDLGGWHPRPGLRERWMTTEAALLARADDAAAASELLKQMGPATTDEGVLAAAHVHLLLGDPTSAAAIRASAAPAAHVRGRVLTALLDALLAAASGDEERASGCIEDALAAAAPCSLRRPFLTDAEPLQHLLQRRIESGSATPAFALDLLERISRASRTDTDVELPLINPLTEREHTILRYLASTLSNAETAAELYLSINTVKTHQRALYRKLGISGRRNAVHRARQLRLL